MADIPALPSDSPGSGAQEGTSPHKTGRPSFEERTYEAAKGAEAPDGLVQELHLHSARGDETETSCPVPAVGAEPNQGSAPENPVDRPVKLMMHHPNKHDADMESGGTESADVGVPAALADIAHEEEAPSTGGGVGALAGMCAHAKSFEEDIAQETKGAESPDGDIQALGLHSMQGSEGFGSKADKQLADTIAAGPDVQKHGAFATPSTEDPPDKMMMHQRVEEGVTGGAPATHVKAAVEAQVPEDIATARSDQVV